LWGTAGIQTLILWSTTDTQQTHNNSVCCIHHTVNSNFLGYHRQHTESE